MKKSTNFLGNRPTWCPGCGDWGILASLKLAFEELGFNPSSVVVVFGIGCSGNMNDFFNAYGFHGLHGRGLANAIGIKIANHKLPVVAVVGDGDCYGEGGNHFIHACRGNHNITVLVHDNRVYGLTTGQVTPTAPKGFKSKSTPKGSLDQPINPLIIAISSGATFVAQSYAGDTIHLKEIIKKAILHKGFSLVNILQPCVTFNKFNTYDYYQSRVFKLSQDFPTSNKKTALEIALKQEEEQFPLGIIYRVNEPAFHENLSQITTKTLKEKKRFKDLEKILTKFS